LQSRLPHELPWVKRRAVQTDTDPGLSERIAEAEKVMISVQLMLSLRTDEWVRVAEIVYGRRPPSSATLYVLPSTAVPYALDARTIDNTVASDCSRPKR
jgi:hypothetical protein